MEEFKKDLLKVCGKNTAALIIFFVLGGVFLAFGLLMWITAYDPFDAQTDGYATMEDCGHSIVKKKSTYTLCTLLLCVSFFFSNCLFRVNYWHFF